MLNLAFRNHVSTMEPSSGNRHERQFSSIIQQGRTLRPRAESRVALDGACRWSNECLAGAARLPQGAATATLWLVRLAALGVLMYAAFWLALLVMFAVAAAWAGGLRPTAHDDDTEEWRDGLQGYGRYQDGVRVDSAMLFEDHD